VYGVQFPALDLTMAPQEPQPRVEVVSLSGAMARQKGSLHHGQRTGVPSTTQRRVARSAILLLRRPANKRRLKCSSLGRLSPRVDLLQINTQVQEETIVQRIRYLNHTIIVVLTILALSACGGGSPDTPEPEPVQPTATATASPVPTETPSVSEPTTSEYASSNAVFYMQYPADWVVNEVPSSTGGLAFAVAPNRELIESKPDFTKPVAFAFGTINQVSQELAQPANLEELHRQAFFEDSLFAFEPQGKPIITTPSPYITYFFMEAISRENDNSVVHWELVTALADLTVVHFGIGVSEAGMAEYGQLALDMLNSVEIDTAVTAKLANE
jgi:hypothetical protein